MPGPTPAKYGPATDLWPERTPTRAEALTFPASRQKTVAFTPTAIVDALKSFTDAEWDAGVVVWMLPGTAAPDGAGAGSDIWIDYGRTGRKRRALVISRDEWGSCTFSKSVRIRMPGVAFGAIEFNATNYALGLNRGILLSDMTEGAIFNMGELWYWGVQSSDNKPTSGVELCNLSIPDSTLKRYVNNNMDVAAIRSGANASISGILMKGLHVAPAFHETPKTEEQRKKPSHTDSCQVSGNSLMSNFKWVRSIIYGSTNAAIQSTGALTGYHFEDVLVVGTRATNIVYPLPEDAVGWTLDGSGRVNPNALNGGPTGCTATRLVVIGTVGSFDFLWQKDSVLSEAPQSSQQPSSGAQWGVDNTLQNKPKSWFLAQAPEQTREYLKAVYDNAAIQAPTNRAPLDFTLAQPTVTTFSATLTWEASSDPEGSLVKYDVERTPGGRVGKALLTTTFRDSSVENGNQYIYQVFAVDSDGVRTGSNSRSVTIGSETPSGELPAPVLSLASITPTSAKISWTASAGAEGYDVMSGPTVVRKVSPTVRAYELTGLTPGEEYSVYVVAWSSTAGRKSSNILTEETPLKADPSPTIKGTVDVWGMLTDFRLVSLAGRQVRLRFAPSGPGVDEGRLFSKVPIEAVVAADGAFKTALYPTMTVSPEVWYTPEISYLEAGQASPYERLPWKLRVPRTGGRIGDLLLAPAPPGVIAVGLGEPDKIYPAYIDLLTATYYKNGVRQ
ncbi:fibronectin type III domain-containing protein [Rathayibacter sp. VKM Ac-2927]|uniref:fibronectin type III domain-containing protein n=1 Tax=Rathayibacter sp. VKM Ac-2927 TaxID=2929478 RepID=UPI001FB3152C|nr:fibronectin type III domain-containing protein [Rathayibacter sp. VKM Ac-2927]MCJ1687797.1 fibronectin type III domain-containing protein [Rathayibacter sp. VKM Ac-2927]